LSSSKLVRLEERPVRPRPGLDRLLELHLEAVILVFSLILPRVDAKLSDGDLLITLGLLFSMPITDKLLCDGAADRFLSGSAPKRGNLPSRIDV
jgi:hypothetical protein